MSQQLGDAPIQPEFHEGMNRLAKVIDEAFNGKAKGKQRKVGFVMIVFPFDEADKARQGDTGRANYISNASRDDVVIMLKEQIRRFEGQPEIEGHA